MSADEPQIGLTSLLTSGDEPGFFGAPVEAGIHLRWTFPQRLGPPDLFIVERAEADNPQEEDFIPDHLYEELVRLPFAGLPDGPDEEEVRARLSEDQPQMEYYREQAPELLDMVGDALDRASEQDTPWPQATLPIVTADSGSRSRLKLFDALLLASLDPYVARMLGLYWVDRPDVDHDPPRPGWAAYRVIGDWGDREWPARRVDFRDLKSGQIRPHAVAVDGVELRGRVFSVYDSAYDDIRDYDDSHLSMAGHARLPLILKPPVPVRELILYFRATVPPDTWRALGDVPMDVSIGADDSQLVVRAAGSNPFELLVLLGPARVWEITHLDYREGTGPVGQIISNTVFVSIPGPGTTFPAPPPVITPRITSLAHETIPAALHPRTGRVPDSGSQVAVTCDLLAPPDAPGRPVRLLVGRGSDPASPAPSDLVTHLHDAPGPAVYAPPTPEPVLPELLGLWPLNRHTRDLKSGEEGVLHGPARYVRGHLEQASASVLQLNGDAYVAVALDRRAALRQPTHRLTLELWVHPVPGQPESALIGNDVEKSYQLSLVPDDTDYLLRYRQVDDHGHLHQFESSRRLAADQWTHAAVAYDGSHVTFYVNSERAGRHRAALGPVPGNGRPALCLGAAARSTPDRPRHAFRGRLADVRIWQDALYPDETADRIRRQGARLAQQLPIADLVGAWMDVLEFPEVTSYIDTGPHQPALQSLGGRFTLQLWVYPEVLRVDPHVHGEWQTLIGNDWENGFWLGLHDYHPTLCLNGTGIEASTPLAAREWHHLTVAYDGGSVRFTWDGREEDYAARLGPVRPNPRQRLYLGAGVRSTPSSVKRPFLGRMAGMTIWQDALTPTQIRERLAQTQFIERPVADGSYAYYVQGIDLFGRVSDWSQPQAVDVADTMPPPPPGNLHVRYRPLWGDVVTVDGATLTVALPSLSLAIAEGRFDPSHLADLVRYDLVLVRHHPDPSGDPGEAKWYRQPLSILSPPERDGEQFRIDVEAPPFAQLRPQVGDRFLIPFDLDLQVTWTWNGLQRLFYPRTGSFHIYRQRGPLHTLRGLATTVVAVELPEPPEPPEPAEKPAVFAVGTDIGEDPMHDPAGGWCQVGASLYKVKAVRIDGTLSLDLEYKARPVIVPQPGDMVVLNSSDETPDYRRPESWRETPISHAIRNEAPLRSRAPAIWRAPRLEDYEALEDQGINWLPEGQVYELRLPRVDFPDPSYASPSPEAFTPGALVAHSRSDGIYHAYNVLWEARDGDDLLLYLQHYDAAETTQPAELLLQNARYYPGQRYAETLTVPGDFRDGEPTVEWAIGLSAVDTAGNESAVGQIATAVAVDRQRPPKPPTPEIERIDRADYHGKSKVRVRWAPTADAPEGLLYQLYRAVDSAVFTRDLEQRRLRTGHYEDMAPAEVFAEDPDFDDWLPVIAHRLGRTDLPSTWQSKLFVGRPHGLRPEGSSTVWDEWDKATPVWRAWADRFYPALTDEQVVDLAGRRGNESAFALVHSKPLAEVSYVDSVDGRVSNRYLYRLRTQSAALQQSAGWGDPTEEPKAPPKVTPPRAPVFTRIEAGDRQITLHWALNREPDLQGYRLYRADSREALEDLRWWGEDRDPRLIADETELPDPRLKTTALEETGAKLVLPPLAPDTPPIAEVLAAYCLDEPGFDRSRVPVDDQPAALNELRNYDPATVTLTLRPLPVGTPVALVYRDEAGEVRMLDRAALVPPHTDEGLLGLRVYYYRIVTVNGAGLVSEGSEVKQARTLEIKPPLVPTFKIYRERSSGSEHTVVLACSNPPKGLEVLVRRSGKYDRWPQTVLDWTDLGDDFEYREVIGAAQALEYHVSVRTSNHLVSVERAIYVSSPNSVVES